jgi:hypothetical protein
MTEITVDIQVKRYKLALWLARAAMASRWLISDRVAILAANCALKLIRAYMRVGGKWRRIPMELKINQSGLVND